MQGTFILTLTGESIVRALFWTLAHSLWQGLALALLTGLVILGTRRSAPALRYNIFLGLFGLFLVTAGVTFFLEMRHTGLSAGGGEKTPALYEPVLPAETPVISNQYTSNEQPRMSVWVRYLNGKANIVVAIWAIILFVRLVRLAVHLGTIQRLRYYRASRADELWQERVRALATRLGIRKGVALLESSVVRIPMMVGVLKPVILVPLGLLAQLPPSQVEAILLHELAHIRRKDYVINILQSFAEILFFFNPAVLWITSLIREERENCCDDIAVGETRSKKEFIHALVSFQEYKQSPAYALAFPGSKNHLLDRVKRIVHHDNKTLNMREKIYLLVCVFITAGLTMAYTNLGQPQSRMGKPTQSVKVKTADTAQVRTANTSMPGIERDTTIAPGDREAMLKERERRLEEAERRLARQAAELDAQQARLNDLYTEQLARLQDLRDSVHVKGRGLQKVDLRLEELGKVQLDQYQLQSDNVYRQNQLETERLQRQYEESSRQYQRAMEQRTRELELQSRQYQRELDASARKMDQEGRAMLLRSAATDRMKNITPIVNMLADKQLIDPKGDYSFSLDKDALIVNGKKQPADVFQVFKEAFIGDPRDYVRYTKKGGSESSSVSKH